MHRRTVGLLALLLLAWCASAAGQGALIPGNRTLVGTLNYCADVGASDAYACQIVPALPVYLAGACYTFKANTANTGPATLALNGLSALALKKAVGGVTTDLADNDIRAGQLVQVCYDGTNLQMQSVLGNVAGGAGSGTVTTTAVNLTLTNAHYQVNVTTGGAGVTITLPAAAAFSGQQYLIVKADAGVGLLTLTPNGTDTLNGVNGSLTLSTQGSWFNVFWESATGWAVSSPGSAGGDASTNTALSVDDELPLFSGTTGKLFKRATQTGILTGASGVLGTITASAGLAAALSDETGSGAAVFATSPTLVTPLLGTPTSATLTNATGLPIATGVSGLGAGVATFLATPSSANLATAVTGETGSGALVFATSPTLVTPVLGVASATSLTLGTDLAVTEGGTGLSGGTSGGILGYTAAGTIASSVALTASALVLGGGAGATPTPLGSLGTTTTVLHGNAAGAPTFGAVSLTADVSGTLPVASGGIGTTSLTANRLLQGNGTSAVLAVVLTDNFPDYTAWDLNTGSVGTVATWRVTTATGQPAAVGFLPDLAVSLTVNPVSLVTFIATDSAVFTQPTDTATYPAGSSIIGLDGHAWYAGTGTTGPAVVGLYGLAQRGTSGGAGATGDVPALEGVLASVINSETGDTTTAARGVRVARPVSVAGHTFTDTYGLLIERQDVAAGTQTTAPYGVRQEASSATSTQRNYFMSPINLGENTTAFTLATVVQSNPYFMTANLFDTSGRLAWAQWNQSNTAAVGANLTLLRSRNSAAAVVSGDTIANIAAYAHDGTDFNAVASIGMTVINTVASNDTPGNILFQTSAPAATFVLTRVTVDHLGLRVALPSAQAIGATGTITADACGGIKRITSVGNVTTDTTNTFTAPGAANAGCLMRVCNVDSADTITLDDNALFLTLSGDIALAPACCIEVFENPTSSVWQQITALACAS